MTATTDHTVPTQTGMRNMISPWAWNHLRACAYIRFVVTAFLVGLTAVLFSVGYGDLAALPLAGAVVNGVWGYWQLSIARSEAPRA